MLSKDQIEQTLKALYNQENWKNLLTELFTAQGAKVDWEVKPEPITLGTKAAAYRTKNLYRLGVIKLADGKIINIYEAEVQNTLIAENRVGLRSLVQSEIIPGFSDAAMTVFHCKDQTDWRFTFMSKWEYPEASGKIVWHQTHPKKFTYVLGPQESNRTARDRFYELQAKTSELLSVLDAFSVNKLSAEFFDEYKAHYKAFNDYLKNSPFRKSVFNIVKSKDAAKNETAEKPIRDFVKRLLGRIVFLYFVQKKGWMESIWAEPGEIKSDHAFMAHLFQTADTKQDFYSTFLVPLFFDTLNKKRPDDIFKADKKTLGKIPYLNGGLFERDFKDVEKIEFKNKLFDDLFTFFNSYNFTIVEDSPDEREVAVDPEMLGHIFENLIEENKKFGTFYTPKEVVHFMTQEALLLHLSKKLALESGSAHWLELKKFVQYKESSPFVKKQAPVIETELDSLKVCDPAIGSGAFPMGILLEIYQMKLQLYAMTSPGTSFVPDEVKEKIIRNSIYGVDIDRGAIDIARLRFWLSLIVDLDKARELPNFDYKFMQGNSLKEEFEGIPLHIKEEKKVAKNTDMFGHVNEPESFYGYLNKNDIDIAKLEEDLYDAHDEKLKEETRKKLTITEKAYIKSCIDDKLSELKQKIENEWTSYKRKTAGLSSKQRDTLKASYQKKVDKLEEEKAAFDDKAFQLKTLEGYEKPYFLWHLYFKHVFDKGGFDIVIANPPYGVSVDEQLYVNSGLGSKDSYGFFIKIAINTLLKPDGTLVNIVSDTWLTISSHFKLRQLVLQNELHKVIRLHPKTFDAVVNPCIFSLTKKPLSSDSVKSNNSRFLSADLTGLHPRKETPEFREKLWHLEEYVGEFSERYAIYDYQQSLIQTNTNLPIFTASPKLFALLNDTSSEKESHKLGKIENAIPVNIRKISVNEVGVDLVKLLEVSTTVGGVMSSDNHKYLGVREKRTIQSAMYKVIPEELIIKRPLNDDEKENGILISKKQLRCYVLIDKGGKAVEEGIFNNYYYETDFVIDWSRESVKALKENNGLRNHQYYFKEGIAYSEAGIYSPIFRKSTGFVFAKASPCIFSLVDEISIDQLLGILCSKVVRYIFKNFINHTVHVVMSDIDELPIFISDIPDLQSLVRQVITKQIQDSTYDYQSNEQKEIDKLIFELYGLNEEDIQEVEYWWARRYPKLARFADTKPRLNVKDQQELVARLKETIARGENKYCEFKSSLRLDIRKGSPEKHIEHTAFKNIAAFLNSEGGTLIIGVDDEKNILGLEQTDYTIISKADKLDEWSKHLDNLIQNFIGDKFHEYLKIQHIPVDGKTVAVIEVKQSAEPVWLSNAGNQEFYIRRTASAITLSGKDVMDYIKAHWK